MKNYVQAGDAIPYTNSGLAAIASGDIVAFTSRIGVAAVDIAVDAQGIVRLGGVFTLPKLAGQAQTQGELLYYDAGVGTLTTVSIGNVLAGMCFESELAAATTVKCKLQG